MAEDQEFIGYCLENGNIPFVIKLFFHLISCWRLIYSLTLFTLSMFRCLSLCRQMPVFYVGCPRKPLHIFSSQVGVLLYQTLFLNMLPHSKHWFQIVFNSDDYIYYAGDMGREMYCVRRGQVEVIGDDGITVVATLGPGSHFGEVKIVSSLCFLHTRTTVTFFL